MHHVTWMCEINSYTFRMNCHIKMVDVWNKREVLADVEFNTNFDDELCFYPTLQH